MSALTFGLLSTVFLVSSNEGRYSKRQFSDSFSGDRPVSPQNQAGMPPGPESLKLLEMIQKQKDAPYTEFLTPYHHRGDDVFLRTTRAPRYKGPGRGEIPYNYPFQDSDILKSRECNMDCSEIYIKNGKICAWRKERNPNEEYVYMPAGNYYGSYYHGNYDRITYQTFDNLCEMEKAKCYDPTIMSNRIRYMWQLVHFGECKQLDEAENRLIYGGLGYDHFFYVNETSIILNDKKNLQTHPPKAGKFDFGGH